MAPRTRPAHPGGNVKNGPEAASGTADTADTADTATLTPLGAENKPGRRAPWIGHDYKLMTVLLGHVPADATTLDIYASFAPLVVTSIDMLENGVGERSGSVRVRLPPPRLDYWYDRAWQLQLQGPPQRSVRVSASVDTRGFRKESDKSVKTPLHRWVPECWDTGLALMGQGFMHQKRTMMAMDEVIHGGGAKLSLKVDFLRRSFSISVTRFLEEPPPPRPRRVLTEYRVDIRFSWVQSIWQQNGPGGRVCLAVVLDSPPEYWCRSRDAAKSHGNDRISWNNMDQWVRMASLTMNQRAARDAAVSLNGIFPPGQAVDLGRWTTFRLDLDPARAGEWTGIADHLRDYDVRARVCPEFRFVRRDDRNMWDCVQMGGGNGSAAVPDAPSSSNIHTLSRSLSFEVAYQLEVCISRNILHESTLDVVFLESLAALAPDRATRMLEYVAERGKRIYQPHTIFRDPRAASYWRKTPPDASLDKDRAVHVRKAIVTPTTIVYATPALEAGNRVFRHFRDYADRFLRVQFTDELLIGRLSGGKDSGRTDNCFSRAFRALKNGIRVGGRHFEFLAFGNSQLRENSTYFFAPTELVSCQDIRDWMGDFSSIKTVAKYAARLGQCLSTTRPVPTFGVPTTVQRIPDVEHGQFSFTDGVGKISKWWARVIASHLRIDKVPSAVQFRMGGCKGIFVVWPDVPSGQVVQVRPSQEKFPSMGSADKLEIVRCSETATATLNQQTIILLTSLGVPTYVLLDLLHEELEGLDAVLKEPRKAVAQLMARIDQNHTTPVLADMVKAGFMASDEPFVWAMLQLWRSWTLKALKEKARITVEKSAFVLGCVDETDTLRGHIQKPKNGTSNGSGNDTGEEKNAKNNELGSPGLPQIFLQVPDLEGAPGGFNILSRGNNTVVPHAATKYKIITGLCLVGRNPSLHPGDLRVVEAVDVPALRHLRDVVVFPRTGDRDIPSMCSGGDLDGDDYFVFWDKRLLPPPKFRNYEAMNYDATREPDVDEVTPLDLIQFFVKHMKHDTLPRIALAHRAFADQLEGRAMNPRCLELAQLHSQAVDYAKTGVPALMPHRLTPRSRPHWMGSTFKRTYRSCTALGQIYDEVQVENFAPAYDKPFDRRILNYYPDIGVDMLRRARRIKTQYDLALRRAMAQKEVASEFEMWSGFAMSRPRVGSDYKATEDLGRLFRVIMTRFRRLCLREVGNSQDIARLGPFVASMYTVTYEEVRIALHEFALRHHRGRAAEPKKTAGDAHHDHGLAPAKGSRFTHHIAPLISFPWLFSHELCTIAKAADMLHEVDSKASKAGEEAGDGANAAATSTTAAAGSLGRGERKTDHYVLAPDERVTMEYSVQNGVPTHHGIPLDISAFDGSREDNDEGEPDGEAEFEPVWALPKGKSRDDVVIELVAPTGPPGEQQEEAEYDGADYDFLMTRLGAASAPGPGTSTKTKAKNRTVDGSLQPGARTKAASFFPWAEIEDDVLSTSSEESLNERRETIVIVRDDDDDDEEKADGGSSNDSSNARASTKATPAPQASHAQPDSVPPAEPNGGPHAAVATTAPPAPLSTSIVRGPAAKSTASVAAGEAAALLPDDDTADDADDEDDVFATVDALFGEKRRKSVKVPGKVGRPAQEMLHI